MPAPLLILDLLAALIGALVLTRWVALLLGACLSAWRRPPLAAEPLPLAVLIPAFNEEAVLERTVRAVLDSDHPDLEIWIIDDGSSDGTAAVARSLAAQHATVNALIRHENAGKSAALNAAIAASSRELIATIDADTRVDPTALRIAAQRMASPPRLASLACNVKVENRTHWLGRWQSIEYISGIHVDRRAQSVAGCITTVPGALALWRRAPLESVGGFSSDTLTEDSDLTIALQRAGHPVGFEPRAIAWTEAPVTIGDLFRQRRRWSYGNLQCLWKHRGALLRSRNRALSLIGLPNYFYVHLGSFLIALSGLLWLPWTGVSLSAATAVSILVGVVIWDLLHAVIAYVIDRERLLELLHVPLQRVAWVLLLWAVFGTVVFAFASRWRVPWAKAARLPPTGES